MRIKCIECDHDFSPDEMVNVDGGAVCKFCKDAYAQKIKEGVSKQAVYAEGVQPMGKLRKRLVFLLKADIVLCVTAVLAGVYEYFCYSSLPEDFDFYNEFVSSDLISGIVGLLQLLLFFILGYTFLKWIYRMNKNLAKLTGAAMRFSPGWSIGFYFIPIANLFKPYQAMKEIWQLSHAQQSLTGSVLNGWWALWLISSLLGNIAFRVSLHVDNINGQLMATGVYILSDAVAGVLSLVALRLVVVIGEAYIKNYGEQ